MQSLLDNFGLDLTLLITQAVNFFIVLLILRFTVYKPLVAFIKKRRARIEEGLEKAEEADRRIAEIAEIKKEKVREAEFEAVKIVERGEERGREREKDIVGQAQQKGDELRRQALKRIESDRLAALKDARAEAVGIVKDILVKTVILSPDVVDEALIKKAADSLEK